MSTLAEIEEAVETLPRPEQETLWQHLTRRLSIPVTAAAQNELERRRIWLEELRQVRERNVTVKAGAPLQVLLDELRGER